MNIYEMKKEGIIKLAVNLLKENLDTSVNIKEGRHGGYQADLETDDLEITYSVNCYYPSHCGEIVSEHYFKEARIWIKQKVITETVGKSAFIFDKVIKEEYWGEELMFDNDCATVYNGNKKHYDFSYSISEIIDIIYKKSNDSGSEMAEGIDIGDLKCSNQKKPL